MVLYIEPLSRILATIGISMSLDFYHAASEYLTFVYVFLDRLNWCIDDLQIGTIGCYDVMYRSKRLKTKIDSRLLSTKQIKWHLYILCNGLDGRGLCGPA